MEDLQSELRSVYEESLFELQREPDPPADATSANSPGSKGKMIIALSIILSIGVVIVTADVLKSEQSPTKTSAAPDPGAADVDVSGGPDREGSTHLPGMPVQSRLL